MLAKVEETERQQPACSQEVDKVVDQAADAAAVADEEPGRALQPLSVEGPSVDDGAVWDRIGCYLRGLPGRPLIRNLSVPPLFARVLLAVTFLFLALMTAVHFMRGGHWAEKMDPCYGSSSGAAFLGRRRLMMSSGCSDTYPAGVDPRSVKNLRSWLDEVGEPEGINLFQRFFEEKISVDFARSTARGSIGYFRGLLDDFVKPLKAPQDIHVDVEALAQKRKVDKDRREAFLLKYTGLTSETDVQMWLSVFTDPVKATTAYNSWQNLEVAAASAQLVPVRNIVESVTDYILFDAEDARPQIVKKFWEKVAEQDADLALSTEALPGKQIHDWVLAARGGASGSSVDETVAAAARNFVQASNRNLLQGSQQKRTEIVKKFWEKVAEQNQRLGQSTMALTGAQILARVLAARGGANGSSLDEAVAAAAKDFVEEWKGKVWLENFKREELEKAAKTIYGDEGLNLVYVKVSELVFKAPPLQVLLRQPRMQQQQQQQQQQDATAARQRFLSPPPQNEVQEFQQKFPKVDEITAQKWLARHPNLQSAINAYKDEKRLKAAVSSKQSRMMMRDDLALQEEAEEKAKARKAQMVAMHNEKTRQQLFKKKEEDENGNMLVPEESKE